MRKSYFVDRSSTCQVSFGFFLTGFGGLGMDPREPDL